MLKDVKATGAAWSKSAEKGERHHPFPSKPGHAPEGIKNLNSTKKTIDINGALHATLALVLAKYATAYPMLQARWGLHQTDDVELLPCSKQVASRKRAIGSSGIGGDDGSRAGGATRQLFCQGREKDAHRSGRARGTRSRSRAGANERSSSRHCAR